MSAVVRCKMFLCVVDITVLLALSVYQLVVGDSLPVTSDSVPVLGQLNITAFRHVFFRAMLSVTITDCDQIQIDLNSLKVISRPNSLRLVLWLTLTWAIWCNGYTFKIRVE